jgi:7-cyano-7-deazaguanine reductase
MSNYDKVSAIAAEHLGKKAGDYSDFVNITDVKPELLVGIPRSLNRVDYDITDDTFSGSDVWHGFEVSALTKNGLPVSGMAKVIYPSNSPNIIESKSMKLYWNSFNMAVLGNTRSDVVKNVNKKASEDLSRAVGSTVKVKFFTKQFTSPHGMSSYTILDNQISNDIVFNGCDKNEDLLIADSNANQIRTWTPNLRSNCRVTHQPDFGDLYIHMKGKHVPTYDSLMQYIVSFRKENHFHEECVEMIYKALHDKFEPDELMVTALYTRRGGWNICPSRTSDKSLLPEALININVSHTNGSCLFRQ